ncbi:MAG: ATP-binding cassette domain-containing protein, partial [Anaerolineae bacterium]|nr:ATP-binding cassette domain-containing protein [Anaerolineae bacterium]
ANTVSKRVHAAEEKLRRIEDNPIPQPPAPLRFTAHFDPQALKGRLPLVVSCLSKRYGTRQIFDDLSFTLGLSSRVVLVGENGAGKSTLLKILVGAETADHGEIYFHPAVKIGYLDQEQRLINPGQTVLEAFRAGLDGTDQQHIAALLHSGLFRYDELSRLVGQLSAGQQRKLQIARLIAEGANLLVLDEPTNYVSFDVLEELETALKDFPGPIIAASHDRRFIQQFEGDVWELRDAQLVQHLHGLEDDTTPAVGEMA